ncbi:isoprenoid synthase domain-containing protein [Roridomyces roridus]|uniref:Isoprenoid synthase domain-containing protein n=1 Tax=Roridomyces roridus TaxID=1738132 RepID=A0AAD7FEJ4_9AGAR|nr:isoprenoid synthase domain-containing protein [Roridomyces roridus]
MSIPTSQIIPPSTTEVAEMIRSYVDSLGYERTVVTLDLQLKSEVMAVPTSWSLGVEKNPRYVAVVHNSVGMADWVYRHHPFEIKVFVSLWTWRVFPFSVFSILVDDQAAELRIPLEQFHLRLLTAEPQMDPLLDRLVLLFQQTPRYWDPICASAIVCSFLDFINYTIIQERAEVKSKRDQVQSASWPPYIRAKDGQPDAFAYMVFTRDACPDVSVYLHAIPDISTFINLTNDVLSFYKEELAGDKHNLVHGRAQTSGATPLDELASIKDECLAAIRRVRAMLHGKGKYEEAWQACFPDHSMFHTATDRYRLSEIGLGQDVVEINSNT